jgi:transcriptional regulator with AAA-type ATPase domain
MKLLFAATVDRDVKRGRKNLNELYYSLSIKTVNLLPLTVRVKYVNILTYILSFIELQLHKWSLQLLHVVSLVCMISYPQMKCGSSNSPSFPVSTYRNEKSSKPISES